MKSKLMLLLILSMLVGCTSCAKKPDDVYTGKSKQKPTVSSNTDKDKLTFDTVENVLNEAKDINSKKYDNLFYSEKFEINQPKEIGLLEMKQVDNFLENKNKLLQTFLGQTKCKTEEDKNSIQCRLGNKTLWICPFGYLGYGENIDDWISLYNKESDFTKYEMVKEIGLTTPYKNEIFKEKDKEVSLKELVHTAEKNINSYMKAYDDMYWVPIKVQVYTDKKEQYYFMFYYEKSFQNMILFYGEYRYHMENVKSPYVCVIPSYAVTDLSGNVQAINNFPGVIQETKVKKRYDKIITLDCASSKLSDKLSSYTSYRVYDVNLEYRLVQTSGKKPDDVSFYRSNWVAGNTYEARPCWTFYLSNDIDNMTFAMVDCITGEVEFISGER